MLDCFTFYNEIELLTYRLNLLKDVIDYFIIVESTHTFTGHEKQLYYNENKHLFEEFQDKIIHIIVDDFPHKYPNINIQNRDQWTNEDYQRNCINRGLVNLNDSDYIIISDLDEIPNPTILHSIKINNVKLDEVVSLEMDFYYYNLNTLFENKWFKAKILNYKKYKELNESCDKIRHMSQCYIGKCGWHLSYFGNSEFIKNKLINFSHQEYNNSTITNLEYIDEKIKMGIDLFARNSKINNIPIENNDNLPPKYDIYLRNFFKK